jgi:hypothetical protein
MKGPEIYKNNSTFLFSLINLAGQESREYDHMDPSRSPRGTLYSQKLALTSPTSGSIVHSWTQAMEFSISFFSKSGICINFNFYTMGSQKVPRMVVMRCIGRAYGNTYINTFKVGPLLTHSYSIDPAISGSTDRRLLLETSGVWLSH